MLPAAIAKLIPDLNRSVFLEKSPQVGNFCLLSGPGLPLLNYNLVSR
jgi:hypothetical protein